MPTDRREFLKLAGLGITGMFLGTSCQTLDRGTAAASSPLIDQVAAACRRLAGAGWRDLFLALTNNALDLTAPDLGAALARPLTINRELPGFEDFAAEGNRGIEPGQPALSLLFHALASPNVTQDGRGQPLRDFPTLAEIEAVENYVYGVRPPSLAELRERVKGAPLAVGVFCREYRSLRHTVHRRHADLCFSRTATTRTGNVPAHYDGRARDFAGLDEANTFAFRVLPTQFAAYIAVKLPGKDATFGPLASKVEADTPAPKKKLKGKHEAAKKEDPPENEDDERAFWVPVHKLFAGSECIRDRTLTLAFQSRFINEKLRKLHRFMEEIGIDPIYTEKERELYPFVMRDAVLAGFSSQAGWGSGVVEPKVHPLFEPAVFKERPLVFNVSRKLTDGNAGLWFSTVQIVMDAVDSPWRDTVAYQDGLNQQAGRVTPEYVNARHRVNANGTIEDLNQKPDLMEILHKGGYRARHFIDFTGDGWVGAACPELAADIPATLGAYVGIAPPDFFPAITQREVMEWWKTKAPESIRAGGFCIEPLALSDQRMAGNIHLEGGGFEIGDDTITTIVGLFGAKGGKQRPERLNEVPTFTRLPDGSNGVFDPGWDFSQDTAKTATGVKLHLANYGLGTPFVEDAKLCAALGSFWPAVAPDAGRVFQPERRPEDPRKLWPWPAIVPLTDEEIGTVPLPDGTFLPWDGVRGPEPVTRDGKTLMRYPNIEHVDYINLEGKLTAKLTARIDLAEYGARVTGLAAVYWALDIREADYLKPENWKVGPKHDQSFSKDYARELALNRLQLAKAHWAVASFRKISEADAELRAARAKSGASSGGAAYRVAIYRWGKQERDPQDFRKMLVEMLDSAVFYVDAQQVLRSRPDGTWERQAPFLMS